LQESQQVTGSPQVAAPGEPSTPGGRSVHHLPQSGERPDNGGHGVHAPNSAPADISRHQLSVALTWVGRGVPVIPCSRTDKGPLVRGFGRDVDDDQVLATFANQETVTSWWSGRYKRAHVGILTGRGAGGGLLVVDLDVRKPGTELTGRFADFQGGTDVLELLAAEAGADWPETYSVLTPSGGMHLYFRQPEGEPIGCATGDGEAGPHLGPLIDVRGVGGLVIAAGSYSAAQGRPYERVSAPDVRPQELPGWLLTLLRRPAPERRRSTAPVPLQPGRDRAERYAAAALQGAADDVANAQDGERNRKLFSATRRLAELSGTAPAVLTEEFVREQLLDAARQAGVGEGEALRTIRPGWDRGVRDGRGAGAA
jgi:Bifunctional DNA primase/polymerase, N-terminal